MIHHGGRVAGLSRRHDHRQPGAHDRADRHRPQSALHPGHPVWHHGQRPDDRLHQPGPDSLHLAGHRHPVHHARRPVHRLQRPGGRGAHAGAVAGGRSPADVLARAGRPRRLRRLDPALDDQQGDLRLRDGQPAADELRQLRRPDGQHRAPAGNPAQPQLFRGRVPPEARRGGELHGLQRQRDHDDLRRHQPEEHRRHDEHPFRQSVPRGHLARHVQDPGAKQQLPGHARLRRGLHEVERPRPLPGPPPPGGPLQRAGRRAGDVPVPLHLRRGRPSLPGESRHRRRHHRQLRHHPGVLCRQQRPRHGQLRPRTHGPARLRRTGHRHGQHLQLDDRRLGDVAAAHEPAVVLRRQVRHGAKGHRGHQRRPDELLLG